MHEIPCLAELLPVRGLQRAREAVDRITSGIPMGQPILVGHHSQRHAERDAKRIENGMRKAVTMWKTSKYWAGRARGVLANLEHKDVPEVRARRIGKLEADRRKFTRTRTKSERFLRLWEKCHDDAGSSLRRKDGTPTTFLERATYLAAYDHSDTWSDLDKGKITPEQAQGIAIPKHQEMVAWCDRWIEHLDHRLEYERALLEASGWKPAPRPKTAAALPILNYSGKAASKNHRDVHGNVIEVELHGLTKAEWAAIGNDYKRTVLSACGTHRLRQAMIRGQDGHLGLTLVYITDSKKHPRPTAAQVAAKAEERRQMHEREMNERMAQAERRSEVEEARAPARAAQAEKDAPFLAMQQAAKEGVRVVSAPQLFPTPAPLAEMMVEMADVRPGMRILEPSAGTGNIARAIVESCPGAHVDLVEISPSLCDVLRASGLQPTCADFLELPTRADYDRVLMNPPFANAQDIAHIKHALKFLKPAGRLVAICANGPRQKAELEPLATTWEELPDGSFASQGTNVRTVLLTIHA